MSLQSTPTDRTRSFVTGIGLYLTLVVVAWLYWPGLHGPLMLDDFGNLQALAQLDNGVTRWQDIVTSNESGPLGRPVSVLTLIGNYVSSGGDTWSYKYTNLMIHLLCGTLVFWLSGLLVAETRFRRHRWEIALWTAATWLLAPMLTSTVLYVIQRMAQLSTLFVLAGLVNYVIGRCKLATHPRQGGLLILGSLLVWLPLAAFSKENGVLLPFLMLVVEVFFFRFAGPRHVRRVLSWVFALGVALPVLAGLVLLVVAPQHFLGGYEFRPFTAAERLLTETRVLFAYVHGLLLPTGGAFGLIHDDFPISTGLFSPPATLAAITGWLSILALAVITRKRPIRVLFFGPVFFLTGNLLESSIFPLELYFEHRTYLPSVGLFLSLALGIAFLLTRIRQAKYVLVLALMIPAFYGAVTYQRVQTWTSWDRILLSGLRAHPNSPRLHVLLADLYGSRGDLGKALHQLDEAVRLKPDLAGGSALQHVTLHCMLGLNVPDTVYVRLRKELDYRDIVYVNGALRSLLATLRRTGCPRLDTWRLASILAPWALQADRHHVPNRERWILHVNVARILRGFGMTPAAIAQLDRALRADPTRVSAELLKLQYQVAMGDLRNARKTLAALRPRRGLLRRDFRPRLEALETYLESHDNGRHTDRPSR